MLDKPSGPTSHDAVVAVRRRWKTRRVGHGGTLDPFATGLLPILVGRATRLAPWLIGLSKSYRGTIRLGVRTDTDDLTGAVVRENEAWQTLDDSTIVDAMSALTGDVEQVPPRYSAKKIGGTPAHRHARRGHAVALAPQRVRIDRFAIERRVGPDVEFVADVGSGTYIRALARDLGEALGCGAHLIALRRTRVGPWRDEEAIPLASVASHDRDIPLRPMVDAVAHLPQRTVSEDEAALIRHGRTIPAGDGMDGATALLHASRLLAVAIPDGAVLKPRVVLDP